MLVTFGICFKQNFDTGYLVFYNTSPPRMFLSTQLLLPATQLGYPAGEFQALQLIVLAAFDVVD